MEACAQPSAEHSAHDAFQPWTIVVFPLREYPLPIPSRRMRPLQRKTTKTSFGTFELFPGMGIGSLTVRCVWSGASFPEFFAGWKVACGNPLRGFNDVFVPFGFRPAVRLSRIQNG